MTEWQKGLIRVIAGSVGMAFGLAIGSIFGKESGVLAGSAIGGLFGLAGKEIGEMLGKEMGATLGRSLAQAFYNGIMQGQWDHKAPALIDAISPIFFVALVGLLSLGFFFWLDLFEWLGVKVLGFAEDSWVSGGLRLLSLISFGLLVTWLIEWDRRYSAKR